MTKAAALAGALLLSLATGAGAENVAPALTVAQARASLAGEWNAQLQYRDYQSGEWQGIPFKTTITMVSDGVTQIRTSAYDDGPKAGTVWITSVSLLARDGTTEYSGTYRAGRPAEHEAAKLRLEAGTDAAHWVLVSETQGRDDDRPARIREVTTREGDRVTTEKQVDFTDDAKDEWLVRNRTVLVRVVG
ncbi:MULTISPECIES: hypothetical protein [unclassified Novosphingobium]|uniref:hypothetical protein n=1 Tax=unclassified Novosphingobium TaxID=2644732 RepID=UPI000EDB7489|nr:MULTISPECIES: hypothetical protein [unclassified Novosphingobium]HCF24063.1 hypothetical protein [Novosphingobium sp.]HQV04425.1 hypothetical protein [Novosphingobium sp.]